MEQSITDVPQDSSPTVSEDVTTQTHLPVAPVVTTADVTPPVGSKTPEDNLYAALAEERRKTKMLEDKLKQQETTDPFEPEVISE